MSITTVTMKERQLLAEITALPKLVDGKVCIINPDNTYILCWIPKTVVITDNFNPEKYCVLNNDKYKNMIVYSTPKEVEKYKVNSLYKEYVKAKAAPSYRIGDKIHIHSRRGIYDLVDITDDYLVITCNKWRYDPDPLHRVPKSDFKCLAGGIWNHAL